MRIKAKILWGLLGMCLVVGLVGGHAINRQRAVGTLEATSEAEEDARVLAAIVAADHDPAHVLSEKSRAISTRRDGRSRWWIVINSSSRLRCRRRWAR